MEYKEKIFNYKETCNKGDRVFDKTLATTPAFEQNGKRIITEEEKAMRKRVKESTLKITLIVVLILCGLLVQWVVL